jgi:hypothetical protein
MVLDGVREQAPNRIDTLTSIQAKIHSTGEARPLSHPDRTDRAYV